MSLHEWLECYDPPPRAASGRASGRLRRWLAIISLAILAAWLVLRYIPIPFGIMPAN
jgi:hypothetical protein